MESSSLQELEQIPGVGKTIALNMRNKKSRLLTGFVNRRQRILPVVGILLGFSWVGVFVNFFEFLCGEMRINLCG